jgi:predicted nucleotidyltransferase
MHDKIHQLVNKGLPEVKENILATLAYFDLFDYPLTRGEIYVFLSNKYHYDDFDHALKDLLDEGRIYQFDRFYSLKNDHYLAVRRIEGNKKAVDLIKIAASVGSILIRFPYVRGIAISGSLSKNFADEHSDIDLFIITAKNRLWIARTLMHCFKKLAFLARKEHYFCMNYYIDEQKLEIVEKSIYTAIEIGTLIPLQGETVFEKFYAENTWTRGFLPNKIMRISSAAPQKNHPLKNLVEWLLSNRIGDSIDNLLMKITAGRWLKKTKSNKLNSHGDVMGMETGKHYAKPDPKRFQTNLLLRYEQKIAGLLREYENGLVH